MDRGEQSARRTVYVSHSEGIRRTTGATRACSLTLKREATKPAAGNVLKQQARFGNFVTRFNTDRPHRRSG